MRGIGGMVMQAVQVTGFGGVEKLHLTDLPVPEPGPGEVRVRIRAAALNNSDIWMREGAYGTDTASETPAGWRREGIEFPRVPGSDIAGDIVQTGEGVDDERLHQPVVLFPFRSPGPVGFEHMSEEIRLIGSEHDGGYAEYVVWDAERCLPMPLSSYEKSAVFPISGLTAWHMINRSRVREGDTVLVTGATGGVGSLAVQIAARVFGAKVIAVVRDDELKERMQAIGANDVVSYRSSRLARDVKEAAGGEVDVVLDVVGDALFSESLAVLRKGGTFTTSGASGGTTTSLDFRTLYLKHLNLLGSTLGTWAEFKGLMEAVRNGNVQPLVDRTFPLEAAREAQTYFKESKKLGKVLLFPQR